MTNNALLPYPSVARNVDHDAPAEAKAFGAPHPVRSGSTVIGWVCRAVVPIRGATRGVRWWGVTRAGRLVACRTTHRHLAVTAIDVAWRREIDRRTIQPHRDGTVADGYVVHDGSAILRHLTTDEVAEAATGLLAVMAEAGGYTTAPAAVDDVLTGSLPAPGSRVSVDVVTLGAQTYEGTVVDLVDIAGRGAIMLRLDDEAVVTLPAGSIVRWSPALSPVRVPAGVTLWVTQRGPVASVDMIRVAEEHRGRGLADEAMRDLCRWADRRGVVLGLTPSADFGASRVRLTRWYRGLGFVPNRGRSIDHRLMETMRRDPRPSTARTFSPLA